MKSKKIVIAGGTGFIGNYLANYFGENNEIIILTRNISNSSNNAFKKFSITGKLRNKIRLITWNGKDSGEWNKEIDGCDMLVNLAGKSVNCRYTEKNKKEIFDSRTNAVKAIGDAVRNAVVPPKLWINAASATIYRHATTGRRTNIQASFTTTLVYRFANFGSRLSLNNVRLLREKWRCVWL